MTRLKERAAERRNFATAKAGWMMGLERVRDGRLPENIHFRLGLDPENPSWNVPDAGGFSDDCCRKPAFLSISNIN